MMVGTASLPHILMRYFTTPSVREARQSVAWSLLFIFLLYFSAPAYAAFSKLEVYTNIIGRDLTAVRPWMFTWGELGLIQICGKNAASIDAIVAACKAIAGHPGVVRLQDFVINTDVIVLSTPEIAGLPYVISGLVAAGGLAAALSTADGLLLAIANALSPRRLLQDARPERADHPSAHGRPRALVLRRRGGGCACGDQTGRHPGHGRLGVLARDGRQLPGARHGRLVEARHDGDGAIVPACIAGFGLCLFYLVVHPVLPRLRREVFRHDLAAEPGHGRAAGRHRQGHGDCQMRWKPGRRWPTRWPTRSAGSTSTTSPAACSGCRSASW